MKPCFKPFKTGILSSVMVSTLGLADVAWPKSVDEAALDDGPVSGSPWVRYADWPDARWDRFSDLSEEKSPPIGQIPEVQLPITGDPAKGRELAFDRSRGGSCVACHVMGPDTPELPGNVGPDLSTIGAQRGDRELFEYIYEPRKYNPGTLMPAWGTQALFSVEEIKDIVAYLKTLKTPVVFANPHDDPAKRARPVEDRDNLDPIENPAMAAMERGEVLFTQKARNGQACVTCHTDPQQQFNSWAASMPAYSDRLKRVIGVEEFVARHARPTTGETYLMQSPDNTALAVYLRYLANGKPIAVDVESAGARAAAGRGEALSKRKIGQLNFACTDCHQQAANRWIRGQWLGGVKGQVAHFPTWRTSRAELWDIRKRFQWCNVAIRANELPPDAIEYGDIELYLTAQNNGLPLSVPGIRH